MLYAKVSNSNVRRFPREKRNQLFHNPYIDMSNETLPVIQSSYTLYKQTADIVTHLQKQWRYSIGEKIEHSILDLMHNLIMAKNAPKPLKIPYLLKASAHNECASMQLRLLLELNLVNETKVFQAQRVIGEIGRMLGGWIKSIPS
ncbi:MAG: hypothetical protein COV60_02240 [Candidatus Magasanikbacteria bacterium CG11_big_fil_rev_8_21_14_0_20_43_7]|uniref:bAvd-like domain-containing protein n=1 Tax=Candidatus Magasanikbacteria bacterium CG11_big_fil_rev_8_21_14_0_20_43_7 TaxID=1974654 RepID=A0A2H0N2H3_9BACT|nr:MAG: hypothetical protein COV60_02240 [Candidatus Magasanikbacteria bacterium CG11_big_fil_rev_8_21_14_0_20_43_7]